MTRPHILLDCDGVLADFVGGVLAELKYYQTIPEETTEADVTAWDIAGVLGITWPDINRVVYSPDFVARLPVYDGAHDFVDALREIGDVTIVTSPYTGAVYWAQERLDWLKENFGFEAKDVCSWGRKERVMGDILVDDARHNAQAFAETGRPVTLIARPWNDAAPLCLVSRVSGYAAALDDVRTALEKPPQALPFPYYENFAPRQK